MVVSIRETSGRTQTGVIRNFPFEENFEYGVLSDNWTQDFLYSKTSWEIKELYEASNQLVFSPFDEYDTHQSTLLISPIIDFANQRNAIISFDYRNAITYLDVLYHRSTIDTWHLLKRLRNTEVDSYETIDETKIESNVCIELSALTSEYQIAFKADFNQGTGLGKLSTEIAAIDNLKIETKYPVYVNTLPCEQYGSTRATIPLQIFEGKDDIVKKGVSWSLNQIDWVNIGSINGKDSVELKDLPRGTQIYYRAYAKANTEYYYGKILSFITFDLSKGEGTKDNPFLIENIVDWGVLSTIIENGNSCTNTYFYVGARYSVSRL